MITMNSPALKTTYAVVSKKFLPITHIFKNKWHPNEAKIDFMSTFSTQAWLKLESAEKKAHTLRGCCACSTLHESASQAFPISSESRKKAKSSAVSLSFNVDELSTPQTFGVRIAG